MTFTIQPNDDVLVGTLKGRLDTIAAPEAAGPIQTLIDNADKTIILDCTELEFISSSGLRLFLTLRKASKAKNKDVIIRGANADIKQVFSITGFASLFKFE